ncbi:hypothetical protein BJP40_19540 [Streptomyces sp. CC53]|uniref:hypothetical protein n=1 Tax=unclassified Streptomyces TaxID=2593676 RepID=UPI0008DCA390|nr:MULTISPECIES: hypothetical protein [unclassified Streptomyces]OII64770.1 hypothetical protein BJP40_19540 [Streptomyces sp. CC53]
MSAAGRRITEKPPDDALRAATGCDRAGWSALLDARGATGRGHAETARHLVEEHGVSGWYAQSVTLGYRQERGLRQVGQSSTGGRPASVSKTASAPPERITEAYTDRAVGGRWLPEAGSAVRTHRPGRSLSADWEGRHEPGLRPPGGGRVRVGVGHAGLPDAGAVAVYKGFRRDRPTALEGLLEH